MTCMKRLLSGSEQRIEPCRLVLLQRGLTALAIQGLSAIRLAVPTPYLKTGRRKSGSGPVGASTVMGEPEMLGHRMYAWRRPLWPITLAIVVADLVVWLVLGQFIGPKLQARSVAAQEPEG